MREPLAPWLIQHWSSWLECLQIWQGAYDPAEMAVRPAISLQGKGDVIQLLEYHHAWCVVRKVSLIFVSTHLYHPLNTVM